MHPIQTRAQDLNHQRTAKDWEKQKYQLQMEYGDILDRIELLSEEVSSPCSIISYNDTSD